MCFSKYVTASRMFTPLDVCIQIASASEHAIRSKFKDFRTRTSVGDSREEESKISVMVADDSPNSFCEMEVSCFNFENNRNRMLIDVTACMRLVENSDVYLEDFPVDETLLEIKGFHPIVVAGSRYRISDGKNPEIIVERSLEVSVRAYEGEVSLKQLEDLDFDEVGDYVADSIGLLNALYRSAKRVPISV